MDLVKVKMLHARYHNGRKLRVDDIAELPPMTAQRFFRRRLAVPLDGESNVTPIKSYQELKADAHGSAEKDLESMKKKELLAHAEENGVEVESKMKKAEIVAAIRGSESTDAGADHSVDDESAATVE